MTKTPVEQMTDDYLGRLRVILRRAPADVGEEALHEVQTHIEDEWQALGGSDEAMRTVLERLGPPESYGRDLALQLILQRDGERRSFLALLKGAAFWASTSLLGSLLVMAAALFIAFALGMTFVSLARLGDKAIYLVEADAIEWSGFSMQNVAFPPDSWKPWLIFLVGVLPALAAIVTLNRFLTQWSRSRLVTRGLGLFSGQPQAPLPPGWERKAVRSIVVFAIIGGSSCLLFTILSGILPFGSPGDISLPEDIFHSLFTLLAFASGLILISAPVLGLLWAARK